MAIYLVAKEKKDLRTQEVKWYPQISTVRPVSKESVIDEIEARCTLTSSDIKAVLDALERSIFDHLVNGESVRLGDLGSFRPTVAGSGFATKAEVTSLGVTKVRVRFTPSGALRARLKVGQPRVKLSMEGEDPDAAAEEAAKGA